MLDDKKSHYIFVISRIFFQVTTTKKTIVSSKSIDLHVETSLKISLTKAFIWKVDCVLL